jgi:signal transduction histidine kinase
VRLPIRVRLTAWYTAVLAVIIAVVGSFVVLQFRSDMKAGIDHDLTRTWRPLAQEYTVEGLMGYAGYTRAVLPRHGAAQVYDSGGRLLATSGDQDAHGIIASPQERAAALAGRTLLITVTLGPEGEPYRAFVAPVRRLGQRHVLAVAEPLAPIEESVERVVALVLVTVPVGLLLAALGGWWLARKALRPVGRMTSKADKIGIDHLSERIAVPRAPDELAHLAVTLNAMLDRLEHGVAEQQRFIAHASHELRTPLAVMRAELDVNLRGDVSGPSRAVLESTREEVDRMSRIVENLLTLANVDEGQLQLLTRPLDLRDEVDAAVRSLAPAAAAKGLDLRAGGGGVDGGGSVGGGGGVDGGDPVDGRGGVDGAVGRADAVGVGDRGGVGDPVDGREPVDGGPVIVEADTHRVHQVLVNFIENAIKYTPAGGEVRVSAWRRGDEAGVTVSDTGPGIPAAARAQVFERFFRVDGARRRTSGGSGLGLAICREIAEAHGGRVWVESEEGRGSAFSLGLPAAPTALRDGYRIRRPARLKTPKDEVTLRDF